MKILFVDDDTTVMSLGGLFIKSFGYTPILVSSGGDAIETLKIRSREIDMMFLDLTMPHVDGFDVLKYMSHHSIDVPTVVQTGISDQRDLDYALSLGAKQYITKPYTKLLVKAMIEKYTKNKLHSNPIDDFQV